MGKLLLLPVLTNLTDASSIAAPTPHARPPSGWVVRLGRATACCVRRRRRPRIRQLQRRTCRANKGREKKPSLVHYLTFAP